jgi:hypothetical protein
MSALPPKADSRSHVKSADSSDGDGNTVIPIQITVASDSDSKVGIKA